MTRLDIAQEALKEAGLRMTSTRHAILQLMAQEDMYYTIDQIAAQAGERKMDTVTVYRIMQAFEELHLVHKLISVNGFVATLPHDEVSYSFFIDQSTNNVQRKEIEVVDFPGFESKKQHVELLGSFTGIKAGENTSEQRDIDQKTITIAKTTKEVGPESLEFQGEAKADHENQTEGEKNRKQKKKLHQKLREF